MSRKLGIRDALISSVIPKPGASLPPLADVPLDPFWKRFDAVAPPHLKLGVGVATVALGVALPLAMYGRTMAALTPSEREEFLARAQGVPGAAVLLDVVKIVGCLAYFNDPAIDTTGRALS